MEVWRPIPSCPGWDASSLGRIRGGTYGKKNGYVKNQTLHKGGRYHLGIRGHGNKWVHRLVCEAFHGEQPSNDVTVDHINRDHKDNRPENLRWATFTQQARNNGDVIARGAVMPMYVYRFTNERGTEYYQIKILIRGSKAEGGKKKSRHKSLRVEEHTLEEAVAERDRMLEEMGIDIPEN